MQQPLKPGKGAGSEGGAADGSGPEGVLADLDEDQLVELRRRRAALAAVLLLVERSSVSEQQLTKLAAPMSGREFAQVCGVCATA